MGKIVTTLPMKQLTTSFGEAVRVRDLGVPDIRALLRNGAVRFVIADVGHELTWFTEAESFQTWKAEVRMHIAKPYEPVQIERFQGEYAFFASQWDDGHSPIVLLSKVH